jgi:hypothetical protein
VIDFRLLRWLRRESTRRERLATADGWATPNRFGPLLDAGMAGRRSGRNDCFGAAGAAIVAALVALVVIH